MTDPVLRRVLIIDDEPDIREIARISLEMTRQWSVLLADCGEQGVAIATTQSPDVILLDMMMPGLDGLGTFQRLREVAATSKIPVLFLTASAQTHARQKYLSAGARGVLLKPFDPGTLAEKIEQAMGWVVG